MFGDRSASIDLLGII